MKKMLIIATMLSSVSSFAATVDFNVTMDVLAPLTITKDADLSFPATVEVGAPTDVVVLPTDGTSAKFTAAGESGKTFTASVANTTVINGADSINIESFVVSDPTGVASSPFTLDGAGAYTLHVGATAKLEAADTAKSYTGTATLTYAYN